jgi:peptidyl-prolyl cis-trans isomerase A (cyclophilin A)
LNGRHTIFGQCNDASITIVKQIARMARDPRDDRPFRPVRITHVTIEKGGASATKPATKKPAAAASKAKAGSQ